MDSISPSAGASAAASPAPAVADATAPAPRRKLSAKLLIVAGAATLVLGLVGTVAVLLWPAEAPGKPRVAQAPKVGKAAAAAAATTASEAPAPTATAVSRDPAPTEGVATQTAAAHAPSALATASAPAAPVSAHESVTPAVAIHASRSHATDEAPIDRLRRRLGEVINGKGQLDAVAFGDLRLRTRAAHEVALKPASHHPVPDTAPRSAGAHGGTAAPPHGVHWAYDGETGPQAWGRLKPEFATCAIGQRQSPIDIRDGLALDLEPLRFDYRASAFGVIDNGHTVQVNVAAGNFVEALGQRWQLQQFHFHRPSEERIDGRQFDMVAHLVHKNDEGRLAVVAVLLQRGAAQSLVQTVWNNLPLEKGEELPARAQIDLTQLLPEDRRYYTYMGSLTTPPCSEGVLWMVMQKPVPVSGNQIDIFARLYPMNARPLQSASGRMIKQSN